MTDERVVVPFEVSGIPHAKWGMRIWTTGPTGMYVSSTNGDAAQHFFEVALPYFAFHRKLFEGTCQIFFSRALNWSSILARGDGEATLRATKFGPLASSIAACRELSVKPPRLLTVRWCHDARGRAYCIIHDPDVASDPWADELLATHKRASMH